MENILKKTEDNKFMLSDNPEDYIKIDFDQLILTDRILYVPLF